MPESIESSKIVAYKARIKIRKVNCWVYDNNNPRRNCWDPHWELIFCNKWHPGNSKIFTPLKIAVRTHFHVRHNIKTTLVFLPPDREASTCYFQVLSPYYQAAKCNQKTPENTYSCIQKVTSQVWEYKKKDKHQH